MPFGVAPIRQKNTQYLNSMLPVSLAPWDSVRGQAFPSLQLRQTYYTAPKTIAATKPNERSVATTFSLIKNSIVDLCIEAAGTGGNALQRAQARRH